MTCHELFPATEVQTFPSRRTSVLRKLGHVTKEGVVTLKGRAACEISTGDELLATELMFNGVFNSLDKHQLVALISCLVPVEKSNVSQPFLFMNLEKVGTKACEASRSIAEVRLKPATSRRPAGASGGCDALLPRRLFSRDCPVLQEEVHLKRELAGPLSQLQETSRSIAEVQRECKLEVDTDQYVESFKPFLMDVVYAWSKVCQCSLSMQDVDFILQTAGGHSVNKLGSEGR